MIDSHKFLFSLNEVADKYIDEALLVKATKEKASTKSNAETANKPKSTRSLVYKLSAALTALAVVAVCVLVPLMKKDDRNIDLDNETNNEQSILLGLPEKTFKKEAEGKNEETAIVLPWEEQCMPERFSHIEVDGISYSPRSNIIDTSSGGKINYEAEILENSILLGYYPASITADKLGVKIGDYVVKGMDMSTQIYHETTVEAYYINGINKDCGVAIKFVEDEKYYPYHNSLYNPETLGQLISDLSIRENLTAKTIYYQTEINGNLYHFAFYGLTKDKLIQMLMFNETAEIIANNEINVDENKHLSNLKEIMSVEIDLEILGYKSVTLSLMEGGYVMTNLLDTKKMYYVGEDKIKDFMNYVFNSLDGYKMVYLNNKQSQSTSGLQSKSTSPVQSETGYNPDSSAPHNQD